MVSVIKLNEILYGNIDSIIRLLERLDVADISIKHNEIRFAYEEGKNPSACVVNPDTLTYCSFSRAETGTIYTLIMNKRNLSFPQSLHWVANVLGLEQRSLTNNIKLPFGGFYKELSSPPVNYGEDNKILDEALLTPYANKYNQMFFKDGISYLTQEKFNVGLDISSNRITIPEYDLQGNLIGIMGRLNVVNCEDKDRWLPIIPCHRGSSLYGFHINYQDIIKKQICLIGESEKFVMQLDTMRLNCGLATCGNNISKLQEKAIKMLKVPTIILAYDEGLDEEHIRKQALKLKSDNMLYENRVGYIYDRDNIILPKDSKCSPADLGKDNLHRLMKECVVWV